jgi:hypothetical protein
MRNEGYRSPNVADALMLTFIVEDPSADSSTGYKQPAFESESPYYNSPPPTDEPLKITSKFI